MFNAQQLDFLRDALCLCEEPFGMFYTTEKPEGFGPPEDGGHGCIVRSIRAGRARQKPAWISREKSGCRGAAVYAGYVPPNDSIASFVSTGSAAMPGERYMPSPEAMWKFFDSLNPPEAPAEYCVFKPLSQFGKGEDAQVVVFFARGEALGGLCQLTFFATGDHEAVAFPFGSGCSNIISWPLHYAQKGIDKAIVGGADPSCRPYMAPDELSFAVPSATFVKMLQCAGESFLAGNTWKKARQKIARGNRQWNL